MRKLLVLVLVGLGLVAGACASDGGSKAAPGAESSTTRITAKVDPPGSNSAMSAGCDLSVAIGPGETKQTLTTDGAERWWFRRVPPGGVGRAGRPLVMDLHGYSEGAAIHEQLSGLSTFGDEKGFVTVTPQGQGPVARWDTRLGSGDLSFLGKVLDATEQQCASTRTVSTPPACRTARS